MRVTSLEVMTKGWFIGDFVPSVMKTPAFEVAVHRYPAGFSGELHRHDLSTEYNVVVSGCLTANRVILRRDAIFIYDPGEVADVHFQEDTVLVIVKVPSIPSDKHVEAKR